MVARTRLKAAFSGSPKPLNYEEAQNYDYYRQRSCSWGDQSMHPRHFIRRLRGRRGQTKCRGSVVDLHVRAPFA